MVLVSPALAQEEAATAPIPPTEPAAAVPAAEAPPGRVGRLSLVVGNVDVRSSGEWRDGRLNFPLATGAAVRAGAQSHAGIEIGADAIDLAPDSEIEIVRLDDRAVRVAVVRGRVDFAVRRLGGGESVEVEVAGQGPQRLRPGHYEIDAGSGQIAVSTEGAPSDYDETRLAAPYHVSPYMTGFAELDSAGSWQSTAEFGAVWVPGGLPADWAPYRNGQWRWIEPWGWTWIDDRPWGFATSHYGRWALIGERWAWVPGSFVEHPDYMPAAVAFIGTAGVGLSVADMTGPGIAWFPLAPGETYWPSYSRDLAYVRGLNRGSVSDLETIRLDADGDPPLEIVDGHFANRGFASVVPRRVFVNGGSVTQALLAVPEQRLQDAPVLMGSPQVGPAARQVAGAAPATARSGHAAWVSHIAALVARSLSRAKALQTAFAHHLRGREPAAHLHGAHLRAPAYTLSAASRHTILLRVAHAAPVVAHGGSAKGPRSSTRHRS
jgi:uncharacterized protein DUF6600